MDKIIHKANERRYSNHGWLKSYHSFSFVNYVNPDRIHFGALRVLNEDTVDVGRGFGMYPHKNMETISIPLSGDLEHQDSMGNRSIIQEGDVQVMSADTGCPISVRAKVKPIWRKSICYYSRKLTEQN